MIEPSQAQLEILRRIYKAGAKDLAALLKGTAFQRGKATVLLKQLQQISTQMGLASDAWVTRSVQDMFAQSAQATDRRLEVIGVDLGAQGVSPVSGEFLKINQQAVGAFTRQLARDLAGANANLADSGRRIISRTSQQVLADPAISEVIAKGLISGGNLVNIAKGLRTRLAQGGKELLDSGRMSAGELSQIADFDAGYIQAGKLRLPIDYYCQMVASHQLRQAVVQGMKDRLTQTGDELGDPAAVDLVIIMGPWSGDVCDFYVGKIFSINGVNTDYPLLAQCPGGGPPFHPNCRHTIAPFSVPFASPREIERGAINPKFLDIDLREGQKLYDGPDRVFAARKAHEGQAGLPQGSRAEPADHGR